MTSRKQHGEPLKGTPANGKLLSYRVLEKVNKNGKERHIDSPSLVTRIYPALAAKLVGAGV